MAKGQQRSNREKKKPKQEKVKAAPAPSPFGKADFRKPAKTAKS